MPHRHLLRQMRIALADCKLLLRIALAVGMLAVVQPARAAFVVDSLSGDITTNEINNFVSTIATRNPATNNHGNAMATHGTEPEGMWRMYEATGNIAILNHFIRWMDVYLSRRNDMPLGEHRVMWEGTIAPVWPNIAPGGSGSGYAGCESGMIAGYLALCAKMILETPSIWNTTVPDGNPNGFGVTYKARAQRYLSEVDYVCESYLRPWFVNPANNRIRKPTDPRWAANAGNQSVTAWNRQWLFVMAFLYSAQCHDLLGDNPSYLATYKDIVKVFVEWFVAPYSTGGGVYYTSGGRDVVKWYYEVPTNQNIENIGHAQHDVMGLYECYESMYSSVTSNQVKVYADTTQYVINKGSTTSWADTVDGVGSRTYLKSDFIYLSQWNPALFQMIAQSNISANQLNNDEGCKNTGYILYMKRWLYRHAFSGNYRIVARHSGLGLNVTGSSTSNGAAIVQWPYAGNNNEKWQLVDIGGGSYWLKAVHSGKAAVIQSASTANGALAIQWSYNSTGYRNDEWRLDFLNTGYYRLINRHSGKALDVPASSMSNGTQLGQWTWKAVNNQQFQLISVP